MAHAHDLKLEYAENINKRILWSHNPQIISIINIKIKYVAYVVLYINFLLNFITYFPCYFEISKSFLMGT